MGMMKLHPTVRLAIAWLVLLTPLRFALAQADGAPTSERYFAVELDGQKVGWGLERSHPTADGGMATISEMHFSIARGPVVINLGVTSEFIETIDGEPVSMRATTTQANQVTTERYVWSHDRSVVEHSTEANGRVRTERLKSPTTPWHTPNEVDAFVQRKLAEGVRTIAFATIDPSFGLKPVLTKIDVLGELDIEVMGQTVRAMEWRTTSSATPGIAMTSFVDDEGEALLTELPLGGLQLTVRAASKADALADFKAPELMVATLCKPDRAITRPRAAQRAVYRLEALDGSMPDLPCTGAQSTEPLGAGTLRITIDLDEHIPAEVTVEERAACLAAATMADTTDPLIERLTAQALSDLEQRSASERAERLRMFVASYISDKSLDVGFGSASDVARTREGDCTEHGVLLVALLREAGIPARAVSGLVYIDEFLGETGVFGYHMWAQALLPIDPENPAAGETWVDLDAAIATRPFDATHIALTTSDLQGGALATSMADVARALGNLRIRVESVAHVRDPAPAP